MAGSYNHVVGDDGGLLPDERICGMLECMSGDVAEAVEEMYGMIWLLADIVRQDGMALGLPNPRSTSHWVEWARQNYKQGLMLSPTKGDRNG